MVFLKYSNEKSIKMEPEKEQTTEVKVPQKAPLKKHLSSTFSPMIGQYMSGDQLTHHVSHQLSFQHKKYEPEQEQIVEQKSEKKVKFKKKTQGSDISSDEEDDKDEEKRKYREGLRDRMLDDLELLRDYYKRIYKKALQEKVSNQHKQFKTQQAKALENERRLKEKEEKEKHKVVIRLPKSKVLNDQSYKQGVQETAYNKIIKLEHQLKKQGYLSKVSEIKAFWDFILTPGNLENILDKGKLSWESVLEHEKTYSNSLESRPGGVPSKWNSSNVKKMIAENARPHTKWQSTKHPRAKLFTPSGLTDISGSLSGCQPSPTSNKQKPITKSASNSALTFEQKFPKVEFPPLAAYTLVFGEQEPDQEEIERELEVQRKAEAKRDTRSKLLTMFSHALANRAATQRLIERNDDFIFDQHLDTSPVRELMYHDAVDKKLGVPLTTQALQAHDQATIQDGRQSCDVDMGYSHKSTQSETTLSQDIGSEHEEISRREHNSSLPPIAVPLSLLELTEMCPVQEAKGLSTLWVNPF